MFEYEIFGNFISLGTKDVIKVSVLPDPKPITSPEKSEKKTPKKK
jgi:hypothetical protein